MRDTYREAYTVLNQSDHCVLVMIDRALGRFLKPMVGLVALSLANKPLERAAMKVLRRTKRASAGRSTPSRSALPADP